jgi:hypothetical protein
MTSGLRSRRPSEPVDQDLVSFYDRLLKETAREVFRNGEWHLCERSGWPDNQSFRDVLAWCWTKDSDRFLVVINFGRDIAQSRIQVSWDDLGGRTWRLNDVLSGDSYDRNGNELREAGLYVDLKPWQYHVLQVRAA